MCVVCTVERISAPNGHMVIQESKLKETLLSSA